MPSTLRIKPEDVDTSEKRARYTITVTGCGQTGVSYSCLLADAGFKVVYADADQNLANLMAKGKAPFAPHETETKLRNHIKTGRLTATNDVKTAASQSSIIIINTPTDIDQKRKPDYSNIEKTCKLVGAGIRQDTLIIVTSIVGTGIIEGTLREILENTSGFKIGVDLGLAYCPNRSSLGQTPETRPDREQIVAASDRNSLSAASTVLETISKSGTRKTFSVKAAETAVLFEATQHAVNSALSNEFAIFCERAGLDYLEAKRLLETNEPTSTSSSAPAERNIEDASLILLEDAENLNTKLRTVAVAREINDDMAKHVANLARDALRDCGKTLKRARISLLGISQTPNMKSPPKKLAKKLAKIMEARGAKISVYDPYFSNDVKDGQGHFKKGLAETLEGANCIVLITPHDQFKRLSLKKLKVLMKMPAAIIDLEGVFEPDKIEKEGFAYRGLGRGTGSK
jgi:nucleotide sugar dehydrogenase